MRIDATVSWLPVGGPGMTLVGGAGISLPSPVLDLLGQGVGTAPAEIIGNVTTWGTDFGIDPRKQTIGIFLASAPTIASLNAATLNIALQMAPDLGAAGGYLPGVYQTIGETGPMTVAQLVAAQTGVNQQPIRLDWPPNFPMNLNPRFSRLLFQVPAATNFSAGTIAAAFPTTVRDDQANRFAARNYSVR